KVRGNIINVGSVAGLGGEWGMAAYSASKAAVSNLTRSMALDHGGDGDRVNAVHPGITNTEAQAPILEYEAGRPGFRYRVARQREGAHSGVASVIAFLAGSVARHITGAQIPVDGGTSATRGNPHPA